MTRGLTFPTAARRVTTRRSLSRTPVQAEAAVTLARDDPLSFDKTRSVATIGTLLSPRFRTLTTHGPHEHDDTVQLSRRRRLRRGLERKVGGYERKYYNLMSDEVIINIRITFDVLSWVHKHICIRFN